METGNQEEFYASLAIIGGIVLAGVGIVTALALVAIGLYRKTSKAKLTKEIYEQPRPNGKHKH